MEELGLKSSSTIEISLPSPSPLLAEKNVETRSEFVQDIQLAGCTKNADEHASQDVSHKPADKGANSNHLDVIVTDVVQDDKLATQKRKITQSSSKLRKNLKKLVVKQPITPPASRGGPFKKSNKLKIRTANQMLPDAQAFKENLVDSLNCMKPPNARAQGAFSDSIDLEFVVSAPNRDGASDNQEVRLERQQSVVIRMLHRKIDEDPSTDRQIRPDPVLKEFSCPGLCKSFSEKTITVIGNALVPPINVHQNGIQRRTTSTLHDAMRTSHFREIVNALSESPGLYDLYKERVYPVVDTFYEPGTNSMGSNLHFKCYLAKGVKRTYLEKSNGRSKDHVLDFASYLMGKTIESLHEANGKVHIQIAGEPLVNKLSTPLFQDNSPFQLTPDEMTTRLSFEHNYSTGESVQPTKNPVQETCRQEQSDDLNVFKRSVQLAINEQRRNNRLRQKIQMLGKKVTLMKSKAMDLLVSCRDIRERTVVSSEQSKKKANNAGSSSGMKPGI